VWRYSDESYKEDCCGATHVSVFKKIKVWSEIRYGIKSKLVVLPKKKGDRKLNTKEYVEEIID